MTKLKKKTKLEDLEKRVSTLEARITHIYIKLPPSQSIQPIRPVHFHNGSPCYNDPCVWC